VSRGYPHRFEVYLVQLDPAVGSEIRKSRPCVVVSPDEMNANLNTVIVAPLTSTLKSWPTCVKVEFQGKQGEVALDQIRTVDAARLVKHLGSVSSIEADQIRVVLVEMFI